MKFTKRAAFALLFSLAMVFSTVSSAFAENIGYVDFEKVLSNYEQAQEILADIKVKEAELRKMQADFVKEIEQARKGKNPVGSNQLEKELNEKLTAKVREYRDWAATKQQEIDQTLESAVNTVAERNNVDVVLTKQAIFVGGTDLTNEVLNQLNAQ